MKSEQKNHIMRLLDAGIRLDGRNTNEYRSPIKVEYGVSKTAEGSAKVTIGETEVIAGVKLELGTPYSDTPDEGAIIVGAELLPLSNPEFESGPPGIQAIELARVVDRGIRESKAIDLKKLCITPGEKVWLVIVDICTLNDAGNLFDASCLAAIAALKDAKLPKYDGVKVEYREKSKVQLPLEKEPVAVTVYKIGKHCLIDPVSEEEEVIDARLTVATKEDGTLCALQKGGDVPLSLEEIEEMIDKGIEKAKELRGAL